MLVRGPSAAEGYWNQREKSRSTFEGGWTRSGDKYTRDADGFYIYQGRTDDMFKVSGIWVSPFEVESALIGHDAVLEAAVVPKEDSDGLVKPKAFVVQTALSDFYVDYRLVCYAGPEAPKLRALALDALHANIQDVFNEYGVQIMSPHYMMDPAHPQVVPKEKWHEPPAQPPPAGAQSR